MVNMNLVCQTGTQSRMKQVKQICTCKNTKKNLEHHQHWPDNCYVCQVDNNITMQLGKESDTDSSIVSDTVLKNHSVFYYDHSNLGW